jgi:hypothetical protein
MASFGKAFGVARLFALVFAIILSTFAVTANAAPTKTLILGDWYGADSTLDDIRNEFIGSDARFDQANSASLNLSHGLPTLAFLQQFNSVLAFTDSVHVNLTDLSDLLGTYALSGGRVVLSTFWGQQAGSSGGLINSTGFNPLISPDTNAYNSASLGAYDSSSWLMQGVSVLSASYYRGDYFAGLDAGATLVASWDDGKPLAAYNASMSVVAITLNPNIAGLGHASGDYARLFANGLAVTAVPEPETYAMMLAGLGLLGFVGRRRKQKHA